MATDVSDPIPTAQTTRAIVADVMRPAVTSVEVGAHLAGAAYLMKHSGDTALVVTSDDSRRRPVRVLTDSDISQAVADRRNLEETRISDLPHRDPIVVEPGVDLLAAVRTMLLNRIHHLPVVDGDQLVGIVDMTDVCRPLVG